MRRALCLLGAIAISACAGDPAAPGVSGGGTTDSGRDGAGGGAEADAPVLPTDVPAASDAPETASDVTSACGDEPPPACVPTDSAKANAKCNVKPPPPWMVKADSLSAESTRMYNLARDLEEKSNTEAIKASGLTAEQFVMGVERGTAYVAGGGGLWKFSKNEDAALKAAAGQLKPLVG